MPLISNPRVSVVIPVYNGERYLADALQSVLSQTFKDFELIIIDDGSTDRSAAIVRKFEGESVHYRLRPNGGVSKARNAGVAIARGEYIAFLDQDDLWLPDKLSVQVAYLDQNQDVGGVYSQGQFWENERLGSVLYPEPVGTDSSSIIRNGFGLFMTATVFRKAVLEKLGGFDESFTSGYEDLELTLRLNETTRIGFVPQVLALYRLHSGNSSRTTRFSLISRGLYLNTCLNRYAGDPRISRILYSQMVDYYGDFGNFQIKEGHVQEGRASLREAVRLSTQNRTNSKMLLRSLRRLARSYLMV